MLHRRTETRTGEGGSVKAGTGTNGSREIATRAAPQTGKGRTKPHRRAKHGKEKACNMQSWERAQPLSRFDVFLGTGGRQPSAGYIQKS
ncbi:hypothetical protein [Bacteroides gallinarum]|uniref:hypothetical protein n=1 Tax=Bacteroides gallinarum TaxID=376806 RepID=UPI00046A297F|nr:hypothetical protein [Bacteroides gallinarum]